MKRDFRVWMVRAGQGSYLIEDFLNNECIVIGWSELGELKADLTQEELKQKFREAYPDDTDGRVNQCVGQVWRFFHEFKVMIRW